ncbi:MAG: uracil-DNA glycosylase family protein [Longimicrobiales bacterium]|nr:uracil-DNA glycosylase family protein [Longimicrobiales bacterium]
MSDAPYRPIDCGLHDELQLRAMRRALVTLRYRPEAPADTVGAEVGDRCVTARVVDVHTRGRAEFLVLDSGLEIRLDALLEVDGIAFGAAPTVPVPAPQQLAVLRERVTACRACPRLVAWREQVALEKRAAYRDERYWGRPVPGFGDPRARLLIVGLAPGAHGANRTGRMFTGDRSGAWLYRALHRAGFANQPTFERADDGLRLRDAWLTAAVRCAPPANRPTTAERDRCQPFLEEEFRLLEPGLRAVVALGSFAWNQVLRVLAARGAGVPRPRPRFGHLAEVRIPLPDRSAGLPLLGSYHPSQQNTFTGRLTEDTFDAVWRRAGTLVRGE